MVARQHAEIRILAPGRFDTGFINIAHLLVRTGSSAQNAI
jgi:hypothetical protein